MKQNQFEFKPFDQVLVRDTDEDVWRVSIYSHFDNTGLNNESLRNEYPHFCINDCFKQCIPYNEETAHLIGTNKPYKKLEEKELCVYDGRSGFKDKFTSEELIKFVTQQINNKDLCSFTIMYTSEVYNHDQCTCEMCNNNQPY